MTDHKEKQAYDTVTATFELDRRADDKRLNKLEAGLDVMSFKVDKLGEGIASVSTRFSEDMAAVRELMKQQNGLISQVAVHNERVLHIQQDLQSIEKSVEDVAKESSGNASFVKTVKTGFVALGLLFGLIQSIAGWWFHDQLSRIDNIAAKQHTLETSLSGVELQLQILNEEGRGVINKQQPKQDAYRDVVIPYKD